MPILPSISGPRDLDRLSPEQLEELAAEIRVFLVENVSQTGGHLGPAPCVLVAGRPLHLRHRPPVLCSQDPHRPPGLLEAARPGGARGLPAACGEPARRRRVLSRLQLAELGRRRVPSAHRDRPRGPTRRRGRRRRRADRRHDVGGSEQHLRRQRPQPRDRGQRQRPLLRADHRRHVPLPEPGPHRGGVQGSPPQIRSPLPRVRAGGSSGVPRSARRHPRLPLAVHQQRGPVLQPRHQVPRSRRRPRSSGAAGDLGAGEVLRRTRHRARDHREGPRVPAGPRR